MTNIHCFFITLFWFSIIRKIINNDLTDRHWLIVLVLLLSNIIIIFYFLHIISVISFRLHQLRFNNIYFLGFPFLPEFIHDLHWCGKYFWDRCYINEGGAWDKRHIAWCHTWSASPTLWSRSGQMIIDI